MSILRKIDRVLARHINLKPFYINPNQAIVSFTFDDFPKSAATTAADILLQYNFSATYYCVGDFINTKQDNIEQYDIKDIERLIHDGHEIACHTSTHLNCQSVPMKELTQNLNRNEKIISDLCGKKPTSFSYPFGITGLRSKFLAGRRFITARGISSGLNNNICDFSQLKANKLYSGKTSLNEVQSLIKEALNKKAWLIFYTHDISKDPSSYGCTPQFFEDVVRAVYESKCKVLPIKHAAALFTE